MTRVMICPPTHFGVEYVINPWMSGQVGAASRHVAQQQWDALVATLRTIADVSMIEPGPGLPDMCFAANGGFALGNTFVLSNFAVSQRRPEAPLFRRWAESAGFDVLELPDDTAFEGEGDALWWPHADEPTLWAGYGVRSALGAHLPLAERLRVRVVSLRLIDERFYHLDTCFVPLPEGRVVYYPPAFDERSRALVRSLVAADRLVEVGEEDALNFACNAIRIGRHWIANYASAPLRERLERWGYTVTTTPLAEFMKAGGAAKCLVLVLDQDVAAGFDERPTTASPLRSEVVDLEGHLLAQGGLNRAYAAVEALGGSVRLQRFHGGERADQPSLARLAVTAPDQALLDDMVGRLAEGGTTLSRVSVQDDEEVSLAPVQRAGVAPEDFCCSTIYPTDVVVAGRAVRVQRQRMDAAIVVDAAEGAPSARCVLPRDLRLGEQVVCGEAGVRVTMPNTAVRDADFSFMSSSVTSERRVEAQIEELALEMRRIRARGGRIVVVAGPVVIHTGGGAHLAALIRAGFVQALLTGNALPVHDLETNLFGTSLGVDLLRGAGVRGGHRHHLRTINRIRGAGSIAEAVRAGIVDGGVMYECVRAGIAYVLAGSIRDDGPLPETQMDLFKAQAAYQQQIIGADLVLMLATMLHAIGVGNMTPAGVRMVCVDINPAVVTKLADRGSIESAGIVTDVGLFLQVLRQRLVGDAASAPTA